MVDKVQIDKRIKKTYGTCDVCGKKFKEIRIGVGFGAGTKIICDCPDPFANGSSNKGWNS